MTLLSSLRSWSLRKPFSRTRLDNSDSSSLSLETPEFSETDDLGALLRRCDLYNGSFASSLQEFMKEYVLCDGRLDYESVGDAANYLRTFKGIVSSDENQLLDTALTLMDYLKEYHNSAGYESMSFRKYLLGRDGVLTRQRIRDFERVQSAASPLLRGQSEGVRFNLKGRGVSGYSVSYLIGDDGTRLFDLNDSKTVGMGTAHGALYWGAFNSFFEGDVDTRKTIKHAVNRRLSSDLSCGFRRDVQGYAGPLYSLQS